MRKGSRSSDERCRRVRRFVGYGRNVAGLRTLGRREQSSLVHRVREVLHERQDLVVCTDNADVQRVHNFLQFVAWP
jgi:hypothetical protein